MLKVKSEEMSPSVRVGAFHPVASEHNAAMVYHCYFSDMQADINGAAISRDLLWYI